MNSLHPLHLLQTIYRAFHNIFLVLLHILQLLLTFELVYEILKENL